MPELAQDLLMLEMACQTLPPVPGEEPDSAPPFSRLEKEERKNNTRDESCGLEQQTVGDSLAHHSLLFILFQSREEQWIQVGKVGAHPPINLLSEGAVQANVPPLT